MNPKTRRAALHAIAAIAVLASLNALAHSYAGLYQWAIHHRMAGWQAFTWPAEIDVFLVIGELALYVAYLDAWTTRHKIWPWTTALLGLIVSVAGNIGHLPAKPGAPVPTVDRLTAATSPLAAFAGLAIALLVLKQTRSPSARPQLRRHGVRCTGRKLGVGPRTCRLSTATPTPLVRLRRSVHRPVIRVRAPFPLPAGSSSQPGDEPPIVQDARALRTEYERSGTRLSRRELAIQLRARGHTLANSRIRELADAIGLP